MAFQLEWTIEGEKELSRVLTGLAADTKDLQKPFATASSNLRREFETDVFKTRGAVIGESWKPLSPVTVARKARAGFSSAPLVATGRMQKSFRSVATTQMGMVYNTAEYFKYHQSNKPRKRLPRRVMMKLGENQKEMVVQVFHKHIFKSLKR